MDIGGKNAHGGKNARRDVGERRTAFDRRPIGTLARKAHDPAHGLSNKIEAAPVLVGAGAPEPRKRAVDQPRIVRAKIFISKTETLHHAWRKILDQNIGCPQQPPQDPGTTGGFQIDDHTALVAIHHQEGRCLVTDLRGHGRAGVVALWRFLDLDHIRAHVGEHERARRPSHDMGEINDFQSGQRAH